MDKRPGEQHRHNKVYQVLGRLGVCAKKVHDGKGAFYIITDDFAVESILSDESKQTFSQEGFEVIPPIEYNSMKTIVIKHLDYMVHSFTDDDIIDSVERLNDWAQVESIYRIPSTSKILKIRFKTQHMVQIALDKGIKILYQYIPKWNIEKPHFVKLTPCGNCFQYNHTLKECKTEKKLRCTFCAVEHRQNECKEKQTKCINCGGQHQTLAAACQICKDLIKKRSGEIRDKIRSQSHQQQHATYADATITSKGNTADRGMGISAGVPGLSKAETKEMITTIMSAIVFSHYVEAIEPGSFHKTMTDMYKKNGLKPVNSPTPPTNNIIQQAYREVFNATCEDEPETNDNYKDNDDPTPNTTDDIAEKPQTKRQRESHTPPNKDGKKKKEESMITPKKKSNNEEMPQGHKGEGRAKPKTNSRQRGKNQSSRSRSPSSYSKVHYTKEIGLLMLVKQSSNLEANNKYLRERNRIMMAAIEGEEIKFHWSYPNTNQEKIKQALKKGILDPNQILYRDLEDDLFEVSDTRHNSNTLAFAYNLSL